MNTQQQTDNRVVRREVMGDSAATYARRLSSMSRQWPSWIAYVIAILLQGVLTLVLLALESVLPLSRFPVFYTLATAAVAYWFGLGPAIAAFVLSLTTFSVLFVQPQGVWWPPATTSQGWAGIVAFLVASLVGGLGGLAVRRSRKRIERLAEELAWAHERVTSILEGITDAFLALDLDWRFTYVNPEAGRLLARTPRDLLGSVIWDVFPEVLDTTFCRESHAAMEQHVTVAFEEFYPQIDKWLEVRAYPSAEGLAVYFQDVTERRHADEAIRQVEQHRIEFYRRTLLAASGGKLVMTGRARIEAIAGPPIACWDVEAAEDLRTIRRHVADEVSGAGIDEERTARFSMCVGEATTNALKHAGGGRASLHRLPDSIMLMVCDSGPGIEELNLPDVALTMGFSTAGTLGMGYKVMLSFADKVYLATGDDGSTVAVEIRMHPMKESPYTRGVGLSCCGD